MPVVRQETGKWRDHVMATNRLEGRVAYHNKLAPGTAIVQSNEVRWWRSESPDYGAEMLSFKTQAPGFNGACKGTSVGMSGFERPTLHRGIEARDVPRSARAAGFKHAGFGAEDTSETRSSLAACGAMMSTPRARPAIEQDLGPLLPGARSGPGGSNGLHISPYTAAFNNTFSGLSSPRNTRQDSVSKWV